MTEMKEFREQFVDLKIGILATLLMIFFFYLLLMRGINQTIKNQDRMLCESAKISGNREYLKKCECYYLSGDIECLQNLKK